MSVNCRFTLDEKRHVIDAVNPANSGKGYCHGGWPEDDKHLRERVLMVLLGGMIKKLIGNEGSHSIWVAFDSTIGASHLDTFDPALSIEHKFDGTLRRQKENTQDITSLALFRDEVECVLRDLYSDVDSEAMESIVRAVFDIVKAFTQYVRPDLWKEHQDAEDLDYILGVRPYVMAPSSGQHYDGMKAKRDLMLRVCEVRENPSAFSEYTVEFAARFGQRWDCSRDVRAGIFC